MAETGAMYAVTVGAALPNFYEVRGRTAEFVCGPSLWEPELVTLRAGGLMLMFQWQDGRKVIVWPEELAPVKARFPTPPWSQR